MRKLSIMLVFCCLAVFQTPANAEDEPDVVPTHAGNCSVLNRTVCAPGAYM